MKYVSAIQTPIIEQDVVAGWILRVQAEHMGYSGVEEYTHMLPEEGRIPLEQWGAPRLQELLTQVSEQQNMLFKAGQKVMAQIEANSTVN